MTQMEKHNALPIKAMILSNAGKMTAITKNEASTNTLANPLTTLLYVSPCCLSPAHR